MPAKKPILFINNFGNPPLFLVCGTIMITALMTVEKNIRVGKRVSN